MEEFQYESKDVFLMHAKTGEIVGFHEIGFTAEFEPGKTEWHCEERWGNPYDRFLQFTGNSFRVFADPKDEITAMLNDGWVDLDTKLVNQFNELTAELLMHKYLFYEKKAPIISDADYDAKEREWIKAGMELGLPILEYPHWKKTYQHNKLFWRATQMLEKRGLK